MSRSVRYVELGTQYEEEQGALGHRIHECLATGQWIGGELVEELEGTLAAYCQTKHAIGVGSGTDALIFALQAWGIAPGDEVITASNSFVATAAAIVAVGAKPVFADVLPDRNLDPASVEARITFKTKAIIPVHLSGRVAAMPEILELAEVHQLIVIEDAAQAFGSSLGGRMAGSFGHCGCFSAHPLKNFNACGDAGFVVTDDDRVAGIVRELGNNGLYDRNSLARWGRVSRLDALQAAILSYRLERLGSVIERRRQNAALYESLLLDLPIRLPSIEPKETRLDTYHTFVIQVDARDSLRGWLLERGVETAIHYPVPIHLQPPARALGYHPGDLPETEKQAQRILSLPIHQFLSRDDVEWVGACIRGFYER